MGQAVSPFIQGLVTEEIRRMVAGAIEDGSTVSSASVAAQVIGTYPNCGLTEAQIADEVMIAAARAGVAVEIGGEKGPVPPRVRRRPPVRRHVASQASTVAADSGRRRPA